MISTFPISPPTSPVALVLHRPSSKSKAKQNWLSCMWEKGIKTPGRRPGAAIPNRAPTRSSRPPPRHRCSVPAPMGCVRARSPSGDGQPRSADVAGGRSPPRERNLSFPHPVPPSSRAEGHLCLRGNVVARNPTDATAVSGAKLIEARLVLNVKRNEQKSKKYSRLAAAARIF